MIINFKDLKDLNYRMIMFGEIHKETNLITYTENLIRKFKPDYILHEQGIIGKEINKATAIKMLRSGDIYNSHYNENIRFILDVVVETDSILVGVDTVVRRGLPLKEVFRIREDNMVGIINKYYNLPNKPKIALVVGDDHLRMEESRELGRASPLYTNFVHKDDVLIAKIKM